jgi:hypothetical protein
LTDVTGAAEAGLAVSPTARAAIIAKEIAAAKSRRGTGSAAWVM